MNGAEAELPRFRSGRDVAVMRQHARITTPLQHRCNTAAVPRQHRGSTAAARRQHSGSTAACGMLPGSQIYDSGIMEARSSRNAQVCRNNLTRIPADLNS
jgi:hypothetical protein